MPEARIAEHKFHYNLVNGCAVVRPEGACDTAKTEALARLVSSPLIGSRDLILDLSHAHYVETPGFRWLMRQVRSLESDGRKLMVVGLAPSVDRAFRLLKLEKMIGVADDVSQALDRIHGAKEPAVV